LKKEFNDQTKENTFKGKDNILCNEVERLIVKGLESIWHNSQNNSVLEKRKLDERVKYLEENIQNKK